MENERGEVVLTPRSSMQSYWKMDFPPEDIVFVASANSPQFEKLTAALDKAYMVGMDAEWKPVRSPLLSPRVAVLQMSVRCPLDVDLQASDNPKAAPLLQSALEEAGLVGHVNKTSFTETTFLLDMLALSAAAFSAPMKLMLSSRSVLKLGFGFKQDLLHLAASFPGPDAHGCFDKVDPYLDIGKLYCQLRGRDSLSKPRRGLCTSKETSLSAICEVIFGEALCKDVQCSNWESRPLSPDQIIYAAADAHCLPLLFDSLQMEAIEYIKGERRSILPFATSSRSTLVGLAMLLEEANGYVTGSIFRARRGYAQEMVEEAITVCLSASGQSTSRKPSLPKHLLDIARRFGERLLVNEQVSKKKITRKKPRSRQAQPLEDEVELEWIGPPPWDVSVGGDGAPKFLCDIMVEGLARHLRCMGIDTACPRTKKSNPRQLVEQAESERRVLLTRDVKLLRRRLVPANLSYRVMSSNKQEQLLEILNRFNIPVTEDQLLSRCINCNGMFSPRPLTASEAVCAAAGTQSLPKCALEAGLTFWQCSACLHLYWQGSQFARAMEQFTNVICHLSTKMAGDIEEGTLTNNTLYIDI